MEDSHEWGVNTTGKDVQGLEAAPKKWRLVLNDRKSGAFEGWKVNSLRIVHCQFVGAVV